MIKFQHKRISCNCATSRKIREHNVQIISPWKAFLHKFWRISYPFKIFLLFVNIYQWFASESLRHFGLCARISTPIKKILVQVYVDFYVEMKNEEAAFSTPCLCLLPPAFMQATTSKKTTIAKFVFHSLSHQPNNDAATIPLPSHLPFGALGKCMRSLNTKWLDLPWCMFALPSRALPFALRSAHLFACIVALTLCGF